MAKPGPKNPMSDTHKQALATGRLEGKAVRDYLEALRSNQPKRGRKRTPETMTKRLASIESELATADAIGELRLIQERLDLQAELAATSNTIDMTALEAAFTNVAKSYGERTGVSYAAWRAVGVPAAVLKAAGVSRTG